MKEWISARWRDAQQCGVVGLCLLLLNAPLTQEADHGGDAKR